MPLTTSLKWTQNCLFIGSYFHACMLEDGNMEGKQRECSGGQSYSNDEQYRGCQRCVVEESGDQELEVLARGDFVVDWLFLECSLVEFVVCSYACFLMLIMVCNSNTP